MLKGTLFLHYLFIGVYLVIISLPAGVLLASYTPSSKKSAGGQSSIFWTPKTQSATASAENLPSTTITSTPTPTPKAVQQTTPQPDPEPDSPWGQAVQVDDVTWSLRVQPDPVMATPQEIFVALNDYRNRHESPSLQWDDRLAQFAQQRAGDQHSSGGFDKHEGFKSYLEDEENFTQLGFMSLGENAAEHQLSGVHLIEWAYGGDEPHDRQQLDPTWSHVGIGVSGTISVLIFGKGVL